MADASPRLGCRPLLILPCALASGSRLRRASSCHLVFRRPASDADGSLTSFRRVDCPSMLRTDVAFSSCREDDRDWSDAWRYHQSCSSSRRATLISHLFYDLEPTPEFLDRSPRRSPGPALKSGPTGDRLTSCKSCHGTQDLHVGLIPAYWFAPQRPVAHCLRSGALQLRHR